jgi:AAA15 family ATPase/GTPase
MHRAGSGTVELTEEDEAEGTLRWVSLLFPVVEALETGSVLAVDELDVSLHPFLTARLVRLFREKETNPEGAQLLFASHDSTLLGGPEGSPALGRDEIWFVEKEDDGASTLYPLSDFKQLRHEDLERRYLSGQYGAVPLMANG